MTKKQIAEIADNLANQKIPTQYISMMIDEMEKHQQPTELEMVKEFRIMANQPIIALANFKKVEHSQEVVNVVKLLVEEVSELIKALGEEYYDDFINLFEHYSTDLQNELETEMDMATFPTLNLTHVQDAISDIKYHIFNLLLVTGLHEIDSDIFKEVHADNMRKSTEDGTQIEELSQKYHNITVSRERAGNSDKYIYKCEYDKRGVIPTGKLLKPLEYISRNITKVIEEKIKDAHCI